MVDLNPLHWIDKANHAFGDTLASGLEFLGITDPAVDPDGIREIAKKWRALAGALDAAAHDADLALKDVVWEGKAAKELHKRARTTRTQATKLAGSLRTGATALDKFADEAHELITEIGVILAEIVEMEIAGLALSVLTGGLTAIASSLAAGARAAKIITLIARIEQSGSRMGSVIRAVLEAIRSAERALKALKEIKTIAKVGKMAGEGMKFAAFDAALQNPAAFKDPAKLAELLASSAALGIGAGVLGKVLGKGLKKLKPSELAALAKTLKLDGTGLSRLNLRPGEWEKLPASIRNMFKKCARDPIDVATGDMLLAQTDVELPGTLPLVLERTHLSSYRHGGWFGPSWASTLDQRLQADETTLTYAAPDGARLVYPHPVPDTGAPAYPEQGPSLPLTWDTEVDGALRITDPDTGQAYIFHSPLPADDGQAVDLPLQHIQDRNGQRITVHYAPDATPVEITHSGGYRIALDTHRHLPRITGLRLLDPEDPDSRGTTLLSYGYDTTGHLTEITNSTGQPFHFTYDTEGRITSWTDRNNTVYAYTYDEHGRVIRTDGSAGYLSGTLAYDDPTRTTTITDSLGHTTHYAHNEALRLICQTDPLGNTTHQEWDAEHRLTAVTDALGRTTRYEYDEATDAVARVVRPDGRETTAAYNDLGLPARITGPDNLTVHLKYDDRGNRTAVTDPTGATTRFTYNAAGHLTTATGPLGHATHVRNNRAGLPTQITDPLNAVTRYTRDAFGRPTTLTNPLGATTHLDWTLEGHLARRTDPDGTTNTWAYDGEGNCTHHTDPLGAVSHFEYTHFDLMSTRTGPDGVRHEFQHDPELRLTQVRNPQGLAWNYTYDPAGRLTSETDFDDRTLTYTHDAAAQLTTRTDALQQTVRYTRDALGRTLTKDSAGAVTTYTYDRFDQLAEAAGPDATVTFQRDNHGRLVSETVNGRTLTFGHDALGRRTSRRTPSGAASTWTYDATGRRDTLTTSGRTLTFEHDAAGHELTRRIGESVTLTSAYDPLGRLTDQRISSTDRSIQQRAYTYRPDGYLTGIDDQLSGPSTFTLDPVGRVTHVNAPNWSESYSYDAAGNQTTASWPTTHPGREATGARDYTGTTLTRAGTVRYEHDALGRTTLRQKPRPSRKPDTWHYTWDAEDQLTHVTTPDGTHWRYHYDPLGRRTSKQHLAADGAPVVERTEFTWDGTTLCEQTTVADELPHSITLTWDHQGLHPIAQTERIGVDQAAQVEIDSRFFAIITDLVGTPTELVDEAGTVAWRARTTLWGTTSWTSSSTTYTPLRFPGQYFDPETGLHHNHHRYYDPESARYLSPDPLGLAPAANPSAYVHNPKTWTDPLGLAPECEEAILGYRKQTDFPQSRRIHIGENGKVTITGKGFLYVNLSGDLGHTVRFRGEAGQIVEFQISREFRDNIRRTAIPQEQPPGLGFTKEEWKQMKKICPEISDPTMGEDLYGIPGGMLKEFREELAKYPGRVVQDG
ncbi:DUF6531 domain-containing protein [Streptomyces sp. NBC_01471]|uniref:DUF6531 domain-containing protein n=1 Tax=Streptomyces sp. NBC_01471 TaxID=2903879 RepID=UPI00324F7F8F